MPNLVEKLHRPIRIGGGALLAVVLVLAVSRYVLPGTAESARVVQPPLSDEIATGETETAVLAGGCFWGMQAVFEHVTGVTEVLSGYSGGEQKTAAYELVSTG